MIAPDVLRGDGRDAHAIHDRAVAPGLAHAVTVHAADAHVGHHLRRRHGDDLGVLERVDAGARQPVVQPHRVRARGEGLRKGVVALFTGHQLGQTARIHRALVGEFFRQCDGLSVAVQRHQRGHVFLRTAHAQMQAVDQAIEDMRHIEIAVHQLVAHAGPTGFLRRDDLDAIFLIEAQHRSHHHAGAIGERNEADLDFLFLRRV